MKFNMPTKTIKNKKKFRQLESGVKVMSKANKLALFATLDMYNIR